MRNLAVIGVIGVALAALAASRLPRPDDAGHGLPVRYRFEPSALTKADASARIPALEVKVAVDQPAPLDLAELADLYAQRAQASGDPRDYEAAQRAAQRSIELLPAPNGARLTLAKLANMRHEFREAIDHTREYLKSGNSPSAYLTLATAHLAMGELVAAADAADIAVDARPHTGSYLMRALVEEAQGRDLEAEADFERAVVVEDFGDVEESSRLRALWGRFLIRRGQYRAAEQALAEALRIVPEMPLALAQQGELALREGKYDAAIALFDRAFGGGRELRYLMDRARAQQLKGDGKGAASTRAQVETLVRGELASTGMGHRLDLVETLVDRGEPKDLTEAIALATEEVARRPSADPPFPPARAYAPPGRLPPAGAESPQRPPARLRDARTYELAARIESKLGNMPRAQLYAAEAARLDPANKGWRTLGMPR